jgi:hypothetical protein
MKNFKEEIEAMKAQIAALENNLVCGCDECECEDQSVGQDIGCEDQVILTRGEVIEKPYVKTISGNYMNVGAETVVFTREELIDFAIKLIERTATACKEAISDTEFEADYICSLELSYNNQIEVSIDNGMIRDTVESEIDSVVETDEDSVGVEVDNILRDMLNEKQS